MNSLKQKYQEKIIPQLKKELKLKNSLATPRLNKITINTSSPEFNSDKELKQKTLDWMEQISGQKPKIARARTSIAGFNLREGDIVGMFVTLRGDRMYDFFQKLVQIVLPRTKDFQGVKNTSFDAQGNYTLGVSEQIVFPEVKYDRIGRIQGLEITINTSAKDPKSARALLLALGMPFAKEDEKNKEDK